MPSQLTNFQYYYGRDIFEDAIINGYAYSIAGQVDIATATTWNLGYTMCPEWVSVYALNFSWTNTDITIGIYQNNTYTGGVAGSLYRWNRNIAPDANNSPVTSFSTGVTATLNPANLINQFRLISTNQVELDTVPASSLPTINVPNNPYVLSAHNNGAQTGTLFYNILFIRMVPKYLRDR